jgi:hypothetical protein
MRMLGGLAAVGTVSVLAAVLLVARFASAAAAERGVDVAAFDRIVLAGAEDRDFRARPRVTVTATGNDLALARLDIGVKDGELIIGQKPGGSMLGQISVRVTGLIPGAGTISGSSRLAPVGIGVDAGDSLGRIAESRYHWRRNDGMSWLTATTLTERLSGLGEMDANASDTAAISLAGVGNISVRGGAKCQSRKTGSGTFVRVA